MVTSSEGRVIVCIENHERAFVLLRAAKRRAEELQVQWEAIFIQPVKDISFTENLDDSASEERLQILQTLTLAQHMGAEITHVEAPDRMQGILNVLKQRERENIEIRCIVIASYHRNTAFTSSLRRSLLTRLERKLSNSTVEIIAIPLDGMVYRRTPWLEKLKMRQVNWRAILYALLAVIVANMAAEALRATMPVAIFRVNDNNIGLLFMIACAFISSRFGLLPGMVTAVASFVSLNFFYMLPYYELVLNSVGDALNMVLFLGATFLIAVFGSRARASVEEMMRQEQRTQALFKLHHTTLQARTQQAVFKTLKKELEKILENKVVFFPVSASNPEKLGTPFPKDHTPFSSADIQARDACWEEGVTTGLGAPFDPGTAWRFESLSTAENDFGVIGMEATSVEALSISTSRLFSALTLQVALILERIELNHMMEATRIREEREKLRSMLLSSVSHDLKTPLASIIGSLSVFRSMGHKLPEEQRNTLIETAQDEAQRLDSFITNILDMTRIESGEIEFKAEWIKPSDVLKSVEKRLRNRASRHELIFPETDDTIEVSMDEMMTTQVLQNIVDNAVKYSPNGSKIQIDYRADENGFVYTVRDDGQGIPEDKLTAIFDKYARLHREDSQVAGTGLGLAIAKSVMNAQQGNIYASNHPEGGAIFTIYFPRWRKVTN